MTETEWLTYPHEKKGRIRYVPSMLEFLGPRLSRRKQVLLACGSFHLAYPARLRSKVEYILPWELPAREVAERFVDGGATLEELTAVRAIIEKALAEDPYPTDLMHNTLPDTGGQALNLLRLACGELNSLLEIPEGGMPYERPFPFYDSRESPAAELVRDVFGNPFRAPPVVAAPWLSWKGGTVEKLARSIYEERAFDRLPILADALEDAGCTEESILAHCRASGPHIRGCWVVDRLLGKE